MQRRRDSKRDDNHCILYTNDNLFFLTDVKQKIPFDDKFAVDCLRLRRTIDFDVIYCRYYVSTRAFLGSSEDEPEKF